MIRVLVCDQDTSGQSQLRSVVNAALGSLGVRGYGIVRVGSPADMDVFVRRMSPGFFDLIVCLIDEPSQCDATREALTSVRALEQDVSIVIAADRSDYACELVPVRLSGYCLIGDGAAGFAEAIALPLLHVLERHGDVIGLRFDGGVGSVVLDDILFVEASKKGALVHLASGTTLLVRQTLQAMFDKLSARGSFVKAGNSFIVNLENIRSLGESAIIFPNGESIIMPVRVRKSVKETAQQHWMRA